MQEKKKNVTKLNTHSQEKALNKLGIEVEFPQLYKEHLQKTYI